VKSRCFDSWWGDLRGAVSFGELWSALRSPRRHNEHNDHDAGDGRVRIGRALRARPPDLSAFGVVIVVLVVS
jgi:hypothetical protein